MANEMQHPKELFEFVEANLGKLETEKREVDHGDEYWSERGYEYLIFTKQKDAFLIGRVVVREQEEDMAQGESYIDYYCSDYYGERGELNTESVYQKILNGNYNSK